jgi:DNA polymerase
MSKTDSLRKIKKEILNLKKSPLYKYRIENKYLPVIGEGSLSAKIMFVGEAPGKNEALTGKPFCGAAGRILDGLFAHVGIKRSDVYITSIVKDRPPKNRDPKPKEIEMYAPFLDRQIEIIQPKVIAALGRHAMNYIMNKFNLGPELQPIGKIHGKIYKTKASYGPITIIPLYHPSVASYNARTKDVLNKDFEILNKYR